MVTIRNEAHCDIDSREDLLDRVWGQSRFQKTAERLREGRAAAQGLSLVAEQEEQFVGTVRLWHVCAGPARPALLLGPLAVDEAWRDLGIGGPADATRARRSTAARASSRDTGRRCALLLAFRLLGREDRRRSGCRAPSSGNRLLGCELVPGALDGARGLVGATGSPAPTPSLDVLVAGLARNASAARHAA